MTPDWLLVAKLTAITLLVVVVYLSLGEIGKGELTSAYAVLNRRFAASHGRVS